MSIDIENLAGYCLGEVRELLKDKGVVIDDVKVTSQPREKISEYDDTFRVIRLKKISENKAEILVCRDMQKKSL